MPVRAVVMFTILLGRRWMVHSLTSTGELWAHHEHDVTYQISDFTSKKEMELCGMFSEADTESEIAARVEVLQKLRTFEKRLEYDCHNIPQLARERSFYDLVAHPDPEKWSFITTREAAEKLFGEETVLSDRELFAVQSYLFDNGDLYVSVSRRFLQRQAFWVRPRQQMEDIRTVHRMVLHRDPALDEFIQKARGVVVEARQRADESWNEPPSRNPAQGPAWTEKDMAILRFFVASLQNRRVIQSDPYLNPVAHILKALDMHSCNDYDTRVVHTFLVELGVVAPWEELNSREGIQQDHIMTMDLRPTVSTPILPEPLGPDDLYSHDLVESVRHDFGNMPVYVVDDWGAEELDDGVSIEPIPSDPEHTWLHVHIADPTALLPPTHRIARQALQRTTTAYYVDRTITMLPGDAGFHRYSLGSTPGEPDVAMTFSAKVNSSGDIVDYKIRPSVVRNVRTIKYDEVDALLGHKPYESRYPFGNPQPTPTRALPADPATTEDLLSLEHLTAQLVQRRCKDGAILFAFPKPEMSIDPRPLPRNLLGGDGLSAFSGFPQLRYSVPEPLEVGSRGIIAECMKTAGQVASLFFRDRGIPALRRTVGPVQSEKIDGIEQLLALRTRTGVVDPYESLRARIIAPPGKYITTPGLHSLLGILDGKGYMKVTSPLRRFNDMLAHWQIKHALLAEKGERVSPILFDEDWLRRMGEDISLRELEEKRTEDRQQQFWAHMFLLRWLNDPAYRHKQREHDPLRTLKGRLVDGPIPSIRTRGWQCTMYVPELALSGHVADWPTDRPATLGEEADIAIDRVLLGTHPILGLKLN